MAVSGRWDATCSDRAGGLVGDTYEAVVQRHDGERWEREDGKGEVEEAPKKRLGCGVRRCCSSTGGGGRGGFQQESPSRQLR
jgi:hypothetical protein